MGIVSFIAAPLRWYLGWLDVEDVRLASDICPRCFDPKRPGDHLCEACEDRAQLL